MHNNTTQPYATKTPTTTPDGWNATTSNAALQADGSSRLAYAISVETNCTVISNINGSIAAEWENIPETLILNATIGSILFSIFLWLTYKAWQQSDSNDLLKTQNIVTFLYGYRDPERWYVIPRLEFLRREDRHHQHDMQYPYIYVPPRLPLANPLEMFAYGQEHKTQKSIDSSSQAAKPGTGPGAVPAANATDATAAAAASQQKPPPAPPAAPLQLPPQPPLPRITSHESISSSLASKSTLLRQLGFKSTNSHISDGPLTSPRIESSPGRSGSSMGDGNDSSDTTARRDTLRSGAPGNSFFFPSILTAEQLQASWLSKKLNRFFGTFFRVTDADMIYSRGIDAYEYLLFQRHLIFILFLTTILTIGVILPIHWIAGNRSESEESEQHATPTSFQRSTIKNIPANSHLHWAHIVCSGLIVVVTLKVMSSYTESIMSQEDAQISRRTLLIGNIPSEQRSRVKLTQIFRDYLPRVTVEAIQFVYDTGSLIDSEMYLSSTIRAKEYCQAYRRKKNAELLVRSTDVNTGRVCDGYCRCCSFFYICCCFWPCEHRERGTEYYAREELRFREEISKACEKLVREPTEYAFVTFRSHKHARRVMSELANLKQDVLASVSSSSLRTLSNTKNSGRSSDKVDALEALRSSDLPPQPAPTPQALPSPAVKMPAAIAAMTTKGVAVAGKTSQQQAPAAHPENSLDDSEGKKTLAKHASKFIESANYVAEDPLDPKNNPHVRSIRSPITAAGQSKEDSDSLKKTNKQQQQQHKDDSKSGARHRADKKVPRSAAARHATSAVRLALELIGQRAPTRKLQGPVMWSVRYAPHPDNVEFGDLLNLARTSKYTIAGLHLLMIIIFIFITTPNVVLSMIERLAVLRPDTAKKLTGFRGLMINYATILIQIIATAILPALITLISKQIPYEDSSTKGHSVMWKVYSFLILMVIVMPSIGMSSAQAVFETYTDIDPKCLFPSDNGAYYINYVISSIFLSTILELIKPADILFYYFILWTSRSTAEVESGRQFIEREFSVGMQHTQVLLIFSVVMTYSISCPLIAPVGLVYMCVKHAVDHYNLYYTYFTKKVDNDLQSTIVIFVKVALMLMLFQTTVAIYINTGLKFIIVLTQMIFWITLAALVFNCFFDCTSRSSSSSTKRTRYHNEFCACFYLPKVISNLLRSDAIPHDCISRKV